MTAIFGHLTRLMKKSLPFLWSVQSLLQSEMFLSNSVDMMKNLSLLPQIYRSAEGIAAKRLTYPLRIFQFSSIEYTCDWCLIWTLNKFLFPNNNFHFSVVSICFSMDILSRCRWFGTELLCVGFCNVQFASVFLTSLPLKSW